MVTKCVSRKGNNNARYHEAEKESKPETENSKLSTPPELKKDTKLGK